MEKLETILQAELASQKALEAARSHARDLIKQARAQAELVALEAERKTAGQIEELTHRILGEARAEADSIAIGAEAELGRLVQQAEKRFEPAVRAVAEALRGGS